MGKLKKVVEFVRARLDDMGREIPDPTPLALPSGMKRPETLEEQIARLVRASREAHEAGMDTWEEADDFDIEDDMPDPSTPFEPFFDPTLGVNITPADILRLRDQVRERTNSWQADRDARREAETPPATPPAPPPANLP